MFQHFFWVLSWGHYYNLGLFYHLNPKQRLRPSWFVLQSNDSHQRITSICKNLLGGISYWFLRESNLHKLLTRSWRLKILWSRYTRGITKSLYFRGRSINDLLVDWRVFWLKWLLQALLYYDPKYTCCQPRTILDKANSVFRTFAVVNCIFVKPLCFKIAVGFRFLFNEGTRWNLIFLWLFFFSLHNWYQQLKKSAFGQ